MIYIVMGIPGVGKSAVIDKVVEKTGIKRIVWGDLTEKQLVKRGLAKSRDEMRKLSIAKQAEVQEQVARQIAVMVDEYSDLLIETHVVIKTPEGYWPGLNFDILQKFDANAFIVVEASAKNIMSRRNSDPSRDRKDDLTLEEIEEHIRITREMASTFAVLSGGTVVFVENRQGDLDYAVGKIAKLIKNA
jgi:adenylate kinase